MKIVAIVPIKLNNERLPQKNTKPFTNGKPLCHYIFQTLLKVPELNEIYVYCSNEEIKNFIPQNIKFLKRSKNLDTSSTKINEILSAFSKEIPADIYVLSHATAPFIAPESISKGIQAVKSGDYDSAFSVKKIQNFLWKDGKPFNYELANIPRTQDLKPIFEETSGFYIFKKEIIENLNRRIGENPLPIEVSDIESIDIDEPEDFEIANAIFNQIIKNQEK